MQNLKVDETIITQQERYLATENINHRIHKDKEQGETYMYICKHEFT